MSRSGKLRRSGPSFGSVLSRWVPALAVGALFASVGVVHVASRVTVVSAGYEVSQLGQENQTLVRENDRLKLELATLKNPARLEKLARERLGMAPAPAGAVVLLNAPRRATAAAALASADFGDPAR